MTHLCKCLRQRPVKAKSILSCIVTPLYYSIQYHIEWEYRVHSVRVPPHDDLGGELVAISRKDYGKLCFCYYNHLTQVACFVITFWQWKLASKRLVQVLVVNTLGYFLLVLLMPLLVNWTSKTIRVISGKVNWVSWNLLQFLRKFNNN